jgi:hypothetical protein
LKKRPLSGPLYASRKKVYPQATNGTFRKFNWGLLVACTSPGF